VPRVTLVFDALMLAMKITAAPRNVHPGGPNNLWRPLLLAMRCSSALVSALASTKM
jgi:hypothetical protein